MSDKPSRSDLGAFRDAVAQRAGLRFDKVDAEPLVTALRERVRQTSAKTVTQYLERLASQPQEAVEVASLLSISETYFLRNPDQFRALATVLKEGVPKPLKWRVLSAGCASGEEAYSLAITACEALSFPGASELVDILGVDLHADGLARARAGVFGRWSMRVTPQAVRRKYFRTSGERHQVVDSLRAMVSFEQANLVDAPSLWQHGRFDVVFCRNVLMYFTPAAARNVLANIARSMVPGGYLFLGHAENLRGLSEDFELLQSHDTFFYQRKPSLPLLAKSIPASVSSGSPPHLSGGGRDDWLGAISQASRRIESLSHASRPPKRARPNRAVPNAPVSIPSRWVRAVGLLKEERFQEALDALDNGDGSPGDVTQESLMRAVLLVNTGSVDQAEQLCRAILDADGFNAGAHYVAALCREHASDHEGAVEHSRAAAYLDAGFAMPHLQLGKLARRVGDVATARRELELALSLLSHENSDRIVLFGGGFGRDALVQLCRGELAACEGKP